MQVPLSWLKDYVDLTLPVPDLATRITLAGMEVEEIEGQGDWWNPEKIVVGRIISVNKHPNADRLTLVEVEYGGAEPEQVVTGAPNLFQYKDTPPERLPVLKAPFARNGAELFDAYSDERPRPRKELKPAKIRGVLSNGMVCSERELGLSEEHEGILLLPEDAPVGVPLRDYLGDSIFHLGLTPDMARCLSMIGVAREVAALTDAPLRLPPPLDLLPPDERRDARLIGVQVHYSDSQQHLADEQASDYVAIEIANPDLCNRYIGLIIKNVQIGPSPRWMQDRLRKAGMRPISNVVDITNYVMLEWGQPLHAFDYDRLVQRAASIGQHKPTIIVRTARAGEKLTTLDSVERQLDETMLLITDTAGPIALAGVMGGEETEVSEGTRTILLESATFEGINNRRTAQKLKLPSEASRRFTRGVPARLNLIAAYRAAELMSQYAGGRVAPGMVDAYPVRQEQRIIYTTASDVSRLLGMDVRLGEIANALLKLDCQVEPVDELPGMPEELGNSAFGLHIEGGGVSLFNTSRGVRFYQLAEQALLVRPPWYRLDLQSPADLAEEVARVIGYEHIAVTLMEDVLPPQRHNLALETEEKIRDILTGSGLQETINYSLTTPENHEKLSLPDAQGPYVELANPLSVKRRVMRRSMLVSALENLASNSRYAARLATFELGRVYLPEKGEAPHPLEERRLSILLTGSRRPVGFWPDPAGAEEFDFFDLKGIVETLLERAGVQPGDIAWAAKPNTPPFGPQCAELLLRGESLGTLGRLHAQAQQAYDLPATPVYLAEVQVAPLIKPSWEIEKMQPISSYPPVVEDLAFVVAEQTPASEVAQAIRKAGAPLLTTVELFDLYRGQPIPDGQKSLAYKVTYQSQEKSLTDDAVAAVRKKIIARVEKDAGGTLRG